MPYSTQCNYGADSILTRRYLFCYNNPDEAFEGYKSYKEGYIKKMAEEYKSNIDKRAYEV